MRPESLSYMMVFCALLLAKNRGVSLADSLKVVPLTGGAEQLARSLASKSSE
jgi:hypothetical protein